MDFWCSSSGFSVLRLVWRHSALAWTSSSSIAWTSAKNVEGDDSIPSEVRNISALPCMCWRLHSTAPAFDPQRRRFRPLRLSAGQTNQEIWVVIVEVHQRARKAATEVSGVILGTHDSLQYDAGWSFSSFVGAAHVDGTPGLPFSDNLQPSTYTGTNNWYDEDCKTRRRALQISLFPSESVSGLAFT